MILKVKIMGLVFIIVFCGFLGVSTKVLGQDSKVFLDDKLGQPEKSADNLIVNVDLINVLFTVTDKRGRLVTDLDKKEIKLFEDSKPQAITNFSKKTDLPLT